MASAIDRGPERSSVSVAIHGSRRRCEIQEADISVQIKSTLDLREIVSADQRLLVGKQDGNAGDSGKVDGSESSDRTKRRETQHGNHVHHARDEQRARDAELNRYRPQPMRAIEVEILTGIEHIESADPSPDRGCKQPGLNSSSATGGEPSADGRNSHREPEEELRVMREAFC